MVPTAYECGGADDLGLCCTVWLRGEHGAGGHDGLRVDSCAARKLVVGKSVGSAIAGVRRSFLR